MGIVRIRKCNIGKLYSQLKCVGSCLFCIVPIYYVCSVKPEDRPRIVTPVVAIVIEKPSQLADSLADHPIRIEFKVNQVSFTCELATARCITCVVHWELVLSVQCVMWDVDQSCTRVQIHPALCVYV